MREAILRRVDREQGGWSPMLYAAIEERAAFKRRCTVRILRLRNHAEYAVLRHRQGECTEHGMHTTVLLAVRGHLRLRAEVQTLWSP